MAIYTTGLLTARYRAVPWIRRLFLALCLPALLSFSGLLRYNSVEAQAPNWSLDPADFQFNMNMIIRVSYNNIPSNDPGNVVGVFVGTELRGTATPVNIGGQYYFYVTIYSNAYTAENLRFRAYYAPNDKVYATFVSIPFTHNSYIGTFAAPFLINIDPTLDFAPEILPIPADTTLQNIPFDPISLPDYLLSQDGDPVTWMATPGPNLSVSLVNGILTVSPVSPGWTGTDVVTVKATENTPNQYVFTRQVSFTVLPDYGPPVLQTIPPQTIYPKESFANIDLDNFLSFNGPCRAFGYEVFPFSGSAVAPNWAPVPSGTQAMSMIVRPLFADQVLAGAGAQLAAFVNNTLVGTATPAGIPPNIYYPIALQNLATGPITFRFFHAGNQYVYEKETKLTFQPGTSVGSVAAPYRLQLSPLLPSLAPNGTLAMAIADPTWLGTYPVRLMVWDCDFPQARRDTATALYTITPDLRPTITSGPAATFQETSCATLYDTEASDPQDAEGNGLTYSIAGGADAAKFSIDPQSGTLSWFNFTPDFESPGDANGDNRYEVLVQVTNLLLFSDQLLLTITVTDSPVEAFQPQINGGATAVCLANSAVLQASGGSTYLWNDNSTNAALTVTSIGTYTVTITSAGACSATVSISVSNKPSVAASAGPMPVCIAAMINLHPTPSGGSGVYSYAWSGPNNYHSQEKDPEPFISTPFIAGTYTVTLTDNAGCSATASTTVVVAGVAAPAISASATSPLCQGANLQLSSTPTGGSGTYTQFKWAGPGNFSVLGQQPAGFPATVGASGVYTVTVTDAAGCTATGTASVLVNPLPALSATGNSPVCIGNPVVLGATASGGTGPGYTYQWAGPNSFSTTAEDPASFPATLAAGGTYTVTVTDQVGCTFSSTLVLAVKTLPSVSAALLAPVCADGSVALGATPAGGSGSYAFQWAGPGGFSAMVEDPAAFPAGPAVAGAYTVTVSDQAGCTATAGVSVQVHPVPAIVALNSGPVCQGAKLFLSSSPSGGSGIFVLFNWSGPDAYAAAVEDPVAFSTTPASAGVYQVKVTDHQGCTATATTTVAVNPKPALSAGSNSPVCSTGNIDLQAIPSGGSGVYSTFTWSGPNGYSGSGQYPAGFPADPSKVGTYSVTVTDNTGCSATASTSVAISTNPAPSINAMGNGPVCGGANISLSSTASGGSGALVQFQWSGPNGYQAGVQNPPTFVATAVAGGTYQVTVTDSKGCRGTSSVTVVVNAPVATPGSNSPICLGTTVLLSAGPSGGTGIYTGFSWAGPNLFSATDEHPAGFLASQATVGTYTVTVTDNAGCTGTGTIAVSFENNDPPTIQCPADQELSADGTCSATLGNWVASATNVGDDCTATGNIQVTQMPAANATISGHATEQIVTLTADDGTGNTTPCTFKITLKDNTAPTIVCPPDQTVMADASCSGTVGDRVALAGQVGDNCAASVSVTQMPASATVLSGHNDEKTVTLTANDGHGNTTACSFKVTLKDITPPTITCPPNQTVSADAACSGTVGNRIALATNVSDNCANPAVVSQTPAPGTVLTGHNDEEMVTLTASDGHGNSTPCSFKVILKDVTPPSIACPGPVTVTCASNLPVPNTNLVTASDNCGPVVKEHLSTSIPYDFSCINRFKVTRTYRATDAVGNSNTCTQVITVFDNVLPAFTAVPANVTVQCNAIPAVGTATASDNCAGSVTVAYNGQVVSNIVCTDTYTLTRQWTATDACGNTRRATQRITVRDTQKPTFTSAPPNVTVQCDAVPPVGTPTATDNCDTQVSISFTGETRANGACPDAYTLTRSWLAVDNCSNTRTVTQRITVQDTQKPVFTVVPPNQTIECTQTYPSVGVPTATDNCDASVAVTYLGESTGNASCDNTYELRRTWLATDNCGNSAAVTQIITVQDTQPPTFTSVPGNVTVECSDLVPPIGTPTATDACGGYVQIVYLGDVRTDGNCLYNYTLTRTWKAQDLCGNSTTGSQLITVQDTQAPEFNSPPVNLTVNCANIPGVPALTAQDNCGPASVVYLGQTQSPGDCASGYTITRSWAASDLCGNSSQYAYTIQVSTQVVGDSEDHARQETQPEEQPAARAASVVSGLQLQPNPASGEVWLVFQATVAREMNVWCMDASGRLAAQTSFAGQEGLNRYRLDLSGLDAGLYLVQLRVPGEPAQTKKLVVERR
ncbi:MAG: HYR domain-containing protein [Saprospiraceae bacterium]|nr:HYR domain-containing protein [Saprospiraceae bacterium]